MPMTITHYTKIMINSGKQKKAPSHVTCFKCTQSPKKHGQDLIITFPWGLRRHQVQVWHTCCLYFHLTSPDHGSLPGEPFLSTTLWDTHFLLWASHLLELLEDMELLKKEGSILESILETPKSFLFYPWICWSFLSFVILRHQNFPVSNSHFRMVVQLTFLKEGLGV